MKINDLTGQRFGRLVVLSIAGRSKQRSVIWLCQCDCGNTHVASAPSLKGGKTQSCGCLSRDILKTLHATHGGTYHPMYQTWLGMKQRCSNPNHKDYHRYGGRGVSVCSRWEKDFGAFLSDVGERPGSDYSLDRINNDGDYEPANVRWATPDEQARNRPDRTLLTLNGVTKQLVAWADDIGVAASTLHSRHNKGWSDEKILTTPVRKPSERKRDAEGKWLTALDSELD